MSIDYGALVAEATELASDEDAWTWYDHDRDVAWSVPETFYGRLAVLYREAGWVHCYHRSGAWWHYNVKVVGGGAYRAYSAAVEAENVRRAGLMDTSEVDTIAESIQDGDLESWWESELPDFLYDAGADPYGCGRSGGYVNVPDLETSPENMIRLAEWLEGERAYYGGPDYGAFLASEAIAAYDAQALAVMASPRERVTL